MAEAIESRYQVKIIEMSPARCRYLSDTLDSTVVLQGSASDRDLLLEENIADADIFLALTNDDEANIMSALLAKRLGARVAWAAADNALQIHGGNGFALEYPVSRVLCDARILNIFEGAAEIQAQVIGRGLLARLK